ncbi:porin, partial [Methylobacterium sp. J-067]|nr:porin [Methylobacterium sp. J-067]
MLVFAPAPAGAQTATPVETLNDQTQARTNPDLAAKATSPVRVGPLAPWATEMAAAGFT